MATLAEIRAQFPQYADLSDSQLADAMHKKFYADMPRAAFYQKVGLKADAPEGRSTAAQIGRAVALPVKGLENSVLETVGAIPDLVSAGFRGLGIPAPAPGAYTQGLKNLLMPGAEKLQPEGDMEKALQGVGQGVGDAASFFVPAAAAGRAAQAGGLTQRVGQALATQPVLQATAGGIGGAVGQATESPIMGAAAAMSVPGAAALASRGISPVRNQLGPIEQALANAAEQAGIRLTPGQASGSRPLQAAESALTTLPMSSNAQRRVYDTQRQQFNRAVLDRAGLQADRASPDVLEQGFTTLGQQFDNLAARTTVRADPILERDVVRVAQEYGRRLDTNIAPVFNSYMDDVGQMLVAARQPGANVTIDGRTYQNIRSDISRAARETNNPPLERALNGLVDALDGAMTRSAPPQIAQAWDQVRQQYRNLLTIDRSMKGGTQADRSSGNVPFGSLSQSVRGMDPSGYARGRGDMNEISRVGDFLSSRIPNSGTPERTNMMNLLQGGPAVAAMGAGGTGMVDPATAMLGAAATYGLPPAIQAFINSPIGRAYLANQAAAGLAPTRGAAAGMFGAQVKSPIMGYFNE